MSQHHHTFYYVIFAYLERTLGPSILARGIDAFPFSLLGWHERVTYIFLMSVVCYVSLNITIEYYYQISVIQLVVSLLRFIMLLIIHLIGVWYANFQPAHDPHLSGEREVHIPRSCNAAKCVW